MGCCAHCNKPTICGCGRCQQVFYCSEECLIKHWPKHDADCVETNPKEAKEEVCDDLEETVGESEDIDASFARGVRGLTNFERAFGNLYSAIFAFADARLVLATLNYDSDEDIVRWGKLLADIAKHAQKVGVAVTDFNKMLKGIRSRPGTKVPSMHSSAEKVEDAVRKITIADVLFINARTGGGAATAASVSSNTLLEALKSVVSLTAGSPEEARIRVLLAGDDGDGILESVRNYFDKNFSTSSVNSRRTYQLKEIGKAKKLGIELDKLFRGETQDRRKARGDERRQRRGSR